MRDIGRQFALAIAVVLGICAASGCNAVLGIEPLESGPDERSTQQRELATSAALDAEAPKSDAKVPSDTPMLRDDNDALDAGDESDSPH